MEEYKPVARNQWSRAGFYPGPHQGAVSQKNTPVLTHPLGAVDDLRKHTMEARPKLATLVLANVDFLATSTKGLSGGMLSFLFSCSQIVQPLPSLVHRLGACFPLLFTNLCAYLPSLLARACSPITQTPSLTHTHLPSPKPAAAAITRARTHYPDALYIRPTARDLSASYLQPTPLRQYSKRKQCLIQ